MRIEFTILGEPASKANSREIVPRKIRSQATGELVTRPTSIKSDKARDYEREILRQIPPRAQQRLTGPDLRSHLVRERATRSRRIGDSRLPAGPATRRGKHHKATCANSCSAASCATTGSSARR